MEFSSHQSTFLSIKKIDENQCLLYTVGQSALDGHVLPYAASEVAEVVNDALENVEYEEDDDEDQEEA